MRTLLALRLAVPFGVLILSALPFVAAQTPEIGSEGETLILQGVIDATMGESELSPEAALDEIRNGLLGLNETELDILSGYSLSNQINLALVRQEGEHNDAAVLQQGLGNVAVLLQLGTNISTSATQIGNGNVFGVRLEGHDLILGDGVTQIGDGNVYLLEYTGNGLRIPSTTQIGNDNQAVQVGRIELPFGVEQYGDGMRMVIRHNGAQ